jgi:hypothetical protein
MTRADQSIPLASVSRRAAPWLLWFAVLGGAGAWTVHLLTAWLLEELACAPGSTTSDVLGLPLAAVIAAATLVPLVVAMAALAVAWRLWRRTEAAADGEVRMTRASFMALVGLWADALFTLNILYGAVALLFIRPCVT